MSKVITLKIEDWIITWESVKALIQSLKEWLWELSATKIHPSRSLAQNRLMHALITLCASEYWEPPSEMKKYFKESFLSRKVKNPKDWRRKKLTIVWNTSKLDTKECKVFIDKIIEFWNTQLNLNIVINTNDEEQMLYYAKMIEQEAKIKWSELIF